MQGEIKKQLNNLTSVNDKATAQQKELEEGQGLLVSGELMFGDYHAALVVYGKTAEEAAKAKRCARLFHIPECGRLPLY